MIYLHTADGRREVTSLAPYLRRSLELGMVMDPAVMRPEDVATCRWMGFGIGKGVTSTTDDCSVFAIPKELKHGLHAELVEGFANIDPFPLCYDMAKHLRGFGTYVRWAYFADPAGGPGVLGVDWSIAARSTGGVATTMSAAARVFATLLRHGIPANAEAVLLNWRMCEDHDVEAWRRETGLHTLADWTTRGPLLFAPWNGRCPRCGLQTMTRAARFCARCGCRPAIIWDKAA